MASKIDPMEEEDGEQLFRACREGDLKKVLQTLKEDGIDLNVKNSVSFTIKRILINCS